MSMLSLWLPIFVAAAVVFFASFLAWMVLPHHRSDWTGLGDEKGFSDALTSLNLGPGHYMFPHYAGAEEMKSPEFMARMEAGPRGLLSVWASPPNTGVNLVSTFVFYLVTGIFIAYIASLALEPGDSFGEFFRLTSTVGLLAYSFAHIPNAIWFRRKFTAVLNDILDGAVYGVLTGLAFALLRPATAAATGS